MRKKRNAFTLVELLVVISIIAVLLAILMPSLKKAREQAKKVVCSGNMRQMGVALQCYMQENDCHLPVGHSCNVDDSNQYWLKVLCKYLRQDLLFQCSADTAKDFVDWNRPLAEQTGRRWSSFAINGLLEPQQGYDSLKKIKKPQYCVYVCEKPSTPNWASVDHIHPDKWLGNISLAKANVAYNRHLGKSNYLFADGHSQTFEIEKTYNWPDACLWFPKTSPAFK
ncbi:MAG: prepilin-type N-terminal cleavage/methylation domain-containing protein [Sedimentisphaerales bacterium]